MKRKVGYMPDSLGFYAADAFRSKSWPDDDGTIPAPLRFRESLMIVWPQFTACVSLTYKTGLKIWQ